MSHFRPESQREAARHGHGCLQTLEGMTQNVPHSSPRIISLGSLCYKEDYCYAIPALVLDGETVADFIFGSSKITADGDCSHEIKRRLLLGRKVMTSLDSILKSRDITLPTKVHLVKAMVLPVVMYGCESWTTKKAER